jgi:hypothetical protein
MISFKQYITELGDTEAGREALAIYVGKRTKELNQSVERNENRLKRVYRLQRNGHTNQANTLMGIIRPDIVRSNRRAGWVTQALDTIARHSNSSRYLKIARDIATPGIKDNE